MVGSSEKTFAPLGLLFPVVFGMGLKEGYPNDGCPPVPRVIVVGLNEEFSRSGCPPLTMAVEVGVIVG